MGRTKDQISTERPGTTVPGTGGLVRETEPPRDLPVASELLFDQAPAFVTVHGGAEHAYVYANAPARDVLPGPSPIGRTLRDVIGTFVDDDVIANFDEAYRTGARVVAPEFDARLPDADGVPRTRWFRQTIEPWRGRAGGRRHRLRLRDHRAGGSAPPY